MGVFAEALAQIEKPQHRARTEALLGLCDRLGRLKSDLAAEEASVLRFIEKCGR